MQLTQRFQDALIYALDLHRDQMRKGTDVPYMAHLMAVSAAVLTDGGDEDQAIAALLHDGPEDQGGRATLADIERRFGAHIAQMVEACTDTFDVPKPPWRPRKEQYLQHLQTASPEVRRISLADKVNNARSILDDQLRVGNGVFDRFTGGKEGTLWYYEALAQEFANDASPMAVDLRWVVDKMADLARK
jgi:(p)ppGpp synthase/HD superfamily hydrolase